MEVTRTRKIEGVGAEIGGDYGSLRTCETHEACIDPRIEEKDEIPESIEGTKVGTTGGVGR